MIVRMALRCALVALGIPILAAAAESQGTADQRSGCMADAFRFCMSAIPNHARIEACLNANRRKLSAACRRQIDDDPPPVVQKVKKPMTQDHAPE